MALRRSRGYVGLADHSRNQHILQQQNVCAVEVVGFLREAPWVPPLRGVLSVAFCRHGQKAT